MPEYLSRFIPARPRRTLDVKTLLEMGCPGFAIPTVLSLSSPALLQSQVNKFRYCHDDEDQVARALPGVLETGSAHCFDGAFGFLLPILYLWGYHAQIVLINAIEDMDVDHNVVVYRRGKHLGAVAMSSFPTLKDRSPIYPSLHALMRSYYLFYTSEFPGHEGELSMRGYTDPMDIVKIFGTGWFFRRGDQALMDLYTVYTQGAVCTHILTGGRYPYPVE